MSEPIWRLVNWEGELGRFTVDGPFLVATTAYVVIPSLMVFLALVVPPRANRIANITLSIGYALTISAGAIGEWGYYILGSAIEVALLAAIGYHARTWPKDAQPTSTTRRPATQQTDHPPTAEKRVSPGDLNPEYTDASLFRGSFSVLPCSPLHSRLACSSGSSPAPTTRGPRWRSRG